MTKSALIENLLGKMREELAQAERQARETAEAANHPEAKPDSDKDTRKIELSYLAAGQAARAKELEMGVALLAAVPARVFEKDEPLQAGALVELEMDGKAQRVF